MPRLLVACLVVVFALLATGDTFACPDGCQSAPSAAASDQCSAGGMCVFCAGGVAMPALLVVSAPFDTPASASQAPQLAPVSRPALPLDQPPRLT